VIVVADPDNAVEPAGSSRIDNALFAVPLFATGQTADRNGNIDPVEFNPTASGPFTGAILRGTDDFARLVDITKVSRASSQFKFGFREGEPQKWQRDEDHYAQATLVPPLTSLVRLLRADLVRASGFWGNATFSVNDAYDSLHHHSIPESLHYEGRAVDLDV